MGYAICMGHCIVCNAMMTFNPVRVPSLRVNGVREPMCNDCFDSMNVLRVNAGMIPIKLAADAYEPVDEMELNPIDDMEFES